MQLIISLAAGLAMIFATAIAFWGNQVYGSYSAPVFIILIISYMFKDRIKELTRIFFTGRFLQSHFDHKIKIYTNNKTKIGVFREGVNFIKRSKIPGTILKIRNFKRSEEFDSKFSKESIIYHKKKIELYKNIYRENYHDYHISGINDILRFNITKFLNKMDNPNKEIFLLDSKGYHRSRAKRVYHVNMIIKYTIAEQFYYVRYRIVLTRHGIKRIEKVATPN